MKGASRGRGVPPPCLIKDVTPCFFSSFPQVNDLSPSKFVLLWSRYPVPSAAPSGPRLEADALPPAGRATDSRGTGGGGARKRMSPRSQRGRVAATPWPPALSLRLICGPSLAGMPLLCGLPRACVVPNVS